MVDLPTILLSSHKVERRIHTKRPHTSQHRAGIQNDSHHAHHVAQYPELSTHNLEKMSLIRLQARMTRDTPTEPKIGDADHQPANQTRSIRAGDESMVLLKKAADSSLEPCSVHVVGSSLETDVLRLINQLNGVSLFFSFFLCHKFNSLPKHSSRIGLSVEKGKKREQALACSN
jgi:hypothetical protein